MKRGIRLVLVALIVFGLFGWLKRWLPSSVTGPRSSGTTHGAEVLPHSEQGHSEQGRGIFAHSVDYGIIIDILRGAGMPITSLVQAGYGTLEPAPSTLYWQLVSGKNCGVRVSSNYWTTATLDVGCCGDLPSWVTGNQPWPCGGEVAVQVRPDHAPTWYPGGPWGPNPVSKWLCEVVEVAADAECNCYPCASEGP